MRTVYTRTISILLISAVLLSSCGAASSAAPAQESAAQEAAEAPAQENEALDAAEVSAQENAEQDAAAPVPVTLPLTVLAEEWGWHRHTVGAFLEGLEKLGFVTLERSRSSSTFTITTLSFPAA